MTQESQSNAPVITEYRWYHKAGALVFALFCFFVGMFLIILPWLPCDTPGHCWRDNLFGALSPHWSRIWLSPYFRGAVSGLGLVNIYLALLEMVNLRRFSPPQR